MSLTNHDLAELLFPDVTQTIQDLENQYPRRPNGQIVTRIAPSPTWFIHFWAIYIATVDYMFSKQENGVFVLRIEDTDQKRLIDNGINDIISTFKRVGITMQEWPLWTENSDQGQYGPYIQSHRKHLYRVFAKYLVEQGLAYPCWMSSEQLDSIREEQMKTKKAPGIYGNYALWRNKTIEEYRDQYSLDQGFVLRLRSPWTIGQRILFDDINRGKMSMPENNNDAVLLKSTDGLPTYHFAMLVDDYLMGITHVIRAEEWLTSVPLHIQLYEIFWFTPPQWCHLPQILKLDNGKKRKLSKRHDPEAAVDHLFAQGYAPDGIISFAILLINSNFEEWIKANPESHYSEFDMKLDKIGSSGAIFDMDKFNFINNFYLSKISNQQLFDETLSRAKTYSHDFAQLIISDPDYALAAMSIERHTDLDPKRFNTYADVESQVRFFFDAEFEKLVTDKPSRPEMMTKELAGQFIAEYREQLDFSLSKEERFAQLKEIGKKLWFAASNGEFKEWGYIGKIGDLAMRLRIQLAASKQTPDLYSMMQVMGKDRVFSRLTQ